MTGPLPRRAVTGPGAEPPDHERDASTAKLQAWAADHADPPPTEGGPLVNHDEIEQLIPGYFWGTETPPPDDATAVDIVETRVNYGVRIQNSDGGWSWSGIGLPDLADAERHAANYKGTSAPVPVHRQVVEVTRVTYAWPGRCATEERHVVLSEHEYTGSPDPWA